MNKIRFGIIGMGNIGKQHADYLLAGKVSRAELTAIVSTVPAKRESYAARGLKVFGDAGELFRSGSVDAVIIATPHFQHPELGAAAFAAGLHAMMEKPIAAHKADAERIIAAHREHPRLVFAAMFQMRAESRFQKMRALIHSGRLGKIVRTNWISTDWFRTETYYASSGWRATWRGEGGGVLINQALHNLDMLAWLCGQPVRVRGFCQFGKFHDIEVEDDVTAYLEWADGATGTFITSTGEAPGANRLEIAGTRGKLVLEADKLTLTNNVTDALEFSRTATLGFVKPEATSEEISFTPAESPHATLLQNFVDAILDGAPLLAPGVEGIQSIELANAMVYSSLLGQTVALPLDGAAWERKLNELISASRRL